ncbi:V-type ATP synthase subunit D [bacterium]|nr:V-type ATP synthase subunit D [bacterium]
MMRLAVNATRMQLLRLRKRLAIVRRGHKLLKDKQDAMMRQFMELVKSVKGMRARVEDQLQAAFQSFLLARSTMPDQLVEEAICMPGMRLSLKVGQRQIMNVRVPVLKPIVEGSIRCYGFVGTSGDLDISLRFLGGVLEQSLKLAEAEKTMQLLADDIEKTRRRVNALEYTLIPDLIETIRYITMKLSEMERSNLSRLMRIKNIIRAEE